MEIGFYFSICPDIYMAKQHIEEILFSFPSPWQGAEKYTFWPDEVESDKFWNALTLQNLANTPKLIYVRAAQNIIAQDFKKISSALACPRQNILPIFFLETIFEKNIPKIPAHITKLKCYEFAKKKNWIYTNIGLNEKNIHNYLRQEIQKINLQIDKNLLDNLAENIILDAYFIKSLIAQLELTANNGKITADTLACLSSFTPELKIFDLIRDMENNNIPKIWQKLAKEDDKGESFLFPLLGLLARNAGILWQICAGNTKQIYPSIEFKIVQAKKLGFEGVGKIYHLISQADLAVKSGKNTTLQALESLIINYTNLFSKAPINMSKIKIFENN